MTDSIEALIKDLDDDEIAKLLKKIPQIGAEKLAKRLKFKEEKAARTARINNFNKRHQTSGDTHTAGKKVATLKPNNEVNKSHPTISNNAAALAEEAGYDLSVLLR
ncbi:hypothetical protein [Neptuniibacter sp. QD37_11]|uniref:hypothetical protein n=1 Tax=Neptuniibacter sp. QD37_11 TaxID=3398209 RepID=UPI0039F5520C